MISDDYTRYRRRYDAKRAAGICARSGCHVAAVEGKSLCEMHRQRANEAARAAKKKRKRGLAMAVNG